MPDNDRFPQPQHGGTARTIWKLVIAFVLGLCLANLYDLSLVLQSMKQQVIPSSKVEKTEAAEKTETVKLLQGERRPFYDFLASFVWNTTWSESEWQRFFVGVSEFNTMEPLVPINESCSAPPVPLFHDDDHHRNIRCEQYPTARFAGRRDVPAKVGHAIQFGFDADTLEVHLHELYDIIDKFFILEWTECHNRQFRPKPLTWERIKSQPRFSKFQDKIVHFVLDDLDTATVAGDEGMWTREAYQETNRWKKILNWNEHTKFFGPEDVIGFGDTDEIASRRNVALVKHCLMGMNVNSIDVGIWFPFGNINYAFRTDFPIRGHPYTLGDPSFWSFGKAKETYETTNRAPSRNRGQSSAYLLGGMHMTHYSYLPQAIIKQLTATESGSRDNMWSRLANAFSSNSLKALETQMALPYGHPNPRVVPLTNIDPGDIANIVYHPWFYECNRARYPRWEWQSDSRLGIL